MSRAGFCSEHTCRAIGVFRCWISPVRKYSGCSTDRTLIFMSSEKPELLSSNAAKGFIGTEMIDKSLFVTVNKTLCLPKFNLLYFQFTVLSNNIFAYMESSES